MRKNLNETNLNDRMKITLGAATITRMSERTKRDDAQESERDEFKRSNEKNSRSYDDDANERANVTQESERGDEFKRLNEKNTPRNYFYYANERANERTNETR